jgi:glycosyltransferase involved in cell wall biosynthesis
MGNMIITVVTPTLNGIGYLQECINSVRQNSSANVEVEHVIADGGSTDGTPELAEACGLRVLRRPSKDLFERINEASFDSSGELIGYLGADDVMQEGAMEAIAQAYRRNGKYWVVGGIRWIDENGRSLGGLAAPPTWITPRMHVCLGWNPIMHVSTYLSRDFFTQLNGFNIAYQTCGDYEMFARALSSAPYERLARPVASFRRTGSNNSAVNRSGILRENQMVLAQFRPKSNLERQFWRYALKFWFNLANPEWLMYKLAERTGPQLGSQRAPYF